MFVFGVDIQSVHFQSNCHRYEMSQWTKHPLDVPFGSKCSVEFPLVDVPLVDVPSRHWILVGPEGCGYLCEGLCVGWGEGCSWKFV
jgi:hypothetical protein